MLICQAVVLVLTVASLCLKRICSFATSARLPKRRADVYDTDTHGLDALFCGMHVMRYDFVYGTPRRGALAWLCF